MLKVWQWLARKANVQERVDYATKMAWFRMGIARATGKPADLSWQDYPMYLDRAEGAAYVQMFDKPPQTASYEPPEKHTDGIRPVRPTAKLLPLDHTLGRDTKSLPAYPGQWMREARENLKEKQ